MQTEIGTIVNRSASLIKNRSYLAILSAQLVSNVGDFAHLIAVMWLMNVLTHGNTFDIACVGIVQSLPGIFLSPFAGVWVDRWNQLRTMRIADILSGGIVGGIAILAYLHRLDPITLLVLSFLLHSVIIFFQPAKQSTLPSVVHPDQLMTANSYSQTVYTACTIGGPVLAGVLIGAFGPYTVFVIDSLSFFASFLLLSFVKYNAVKKKIEKRVQGQFSKELREGFSIIMDRSAVRMVILIAVFLNFLFAPLDLFLIQKINDVYLGKAQLLGFLNTAFGVGMLGGSLAIGLVNAKFRHSSLYFIGLLGTGVGFVGLSLSTGSWLGAIAMFVSGFFNVFTNVSFQTIVQRAVPSDRLGRVYSVLGTTAEGMVPLAHFCFGLILNFFAINTLLLVLSSLYLLITFYALTRKQNLDQEVVSYSG